MRIIPFQAEHFLAIEWQDAQAWGRDYYAPEWAEEIACGSDAWTGIDDEGAIVACAGVWPTRILRTGNGPDLCTESMAWAIFSPLLPAHAKSVYKAIRDFLNARQESRIEAWVYASHDKAAPFLERLGFQFEREENAGDETPVPLRLYARVRH